MSDTKIIEAEAAPTCPDCSTPLLLFECVGCSKTNYPQPAELAEQQGDVLLPCPFCGESAERIDFGFGSGDNEGGSCVACTGCGSRGPVEFGFKENFRFIWNRRALAATGKQQVGDDGMPMVCVTQEFKDQADYNAEISSAAANLLRNNTLGLSGSLPEMVAALLGLASGKQVGEVEG